MRSGTGSLLLIDTFVQLGRATPKRNGVRLFAYEGREMLKGLIVEGDDVYTLGMNRSGRGFSFRCNGDLLFSRQDGEIIGDFSDPSYDPWGALYYDAGEICFSYRGVWASELYMCADAVDSAVPVPSDITRIYDVRRYGGSVYMIGATSSRCPVITGNGYRVNYNAGGEMAKEGSYRIFPSREGPLFYGTFQDNTGSWRTTVWDFYGEKHSHPGHGNYYFDCSSDSAYLSFDAVSPIAFKVEGGQELYLSEPYYFFSYRCASYSDWGICLALTPREKSRPMLLTSDGTSEYDFNGFVTSVSVE